MSPKNTLTEQDVKQWLKNLLYFVAPTLVVFFGQLALHVDWRIAVSVAVLALYQALADVFKKYKSGVDSSQVLTQLDVQQTTEEPNV